MKHILLALLTLSMSACGAMDYANKGLAHVSKGVQAVAAPMEQAVNVAAPINMASRAKHAYDEKAVFDRCLAAIGNDTDTHVEMVDECVRLNLERSK